MKLIVNPKDLDKEFKRLCRQYNEYHWAVAWASSSNIHFKTLLTNKNKIKQISIGLHFYQTHPDFIQAFLNDKKLKFIKQPEGTFHPKLYLFYNTDTDWELISGSANFTAPAFTNNTEASLLIGSKDGSSHKVLRSALSLVKRSWEKATSFGKKELSDYTKVWENQRAKINSLSGKFSETSTRRTQIYESELASASWTEFMSWIKQEDREITIRRVRLLDETRRMFERVNHFEDLTDYERKLIAGLKTHPSFPDLEYGLFGSTVSALAFKGKLYRNSRNISMALDEIPLNGPVTESNYNRFINHFRRITPRIENVASASRLLSMKRPDMFVCLNGINKHGLCGDYGIVVSKMNYENYWNELIVSIQDSNWYQNPKPKSSFERNISECRAAILDSIYYDESRR